jgi:hypothetical protein
MKNLAGLLGLLAFLTVSIFQIQKAFATNPGLPASAINSGYAGQMMTGLTATIPGTTATTGIINMKGFSLVGVLLPATFTGTTLTFLASVDGIHFVVLKNTTSGTSLSYTVAQNTFAAINPVDFYGVQYLEIVSGSTEGSSRILTLALKGI